MSTPKTQTQKSESRSRKKVTVITLTPNPTLDVSGVVETLIPNEKNTVRDERRDPGGNGINSARIIQRLAGKLIDLKAMGFLGGSVGQEVASLLRKEGLPSDWTEIRGNTRVNVTVSLIPHAHASPRQTRLSFPGPRIQTQEAHTLIRHLPKPKNGGLLLLGGSLPPGLSVRFWNSVIRASNQSGMGSLVDIPAQSLSALFALLPKNRPMPPLLGIKPNLHELGLLLEKDLSHASLAEIAKASRPLTQKAALICISMGPKGALLVTEGPAWWVKAPRIKARGTVGAGDSFLGAFAFELAREGLTTPQAVVEHLRSNPATPSSPLCQALRLGAAAGAATAESEGTQLAPKKEILRLLRKVPVAKRVL